MEFQSPVLVITPIKPQHSDELIAFLTELNRKLWHEQHNPFENYNKQHFARWVVVDQQLIFAASVDGTAADYLDGLAKHCGELLVDVYRHCENFPISSHPDPESISNFLRAYQEPTAMFYHGLRNRSVSDIQLESQIHRSIEVFLDGNQENGEFKSQSPKAIYQTIKAHLKGTGITFDNNDPYFMSRLTPKLRANRWWRFLLLGVAGSVALFMLPILRVIEWRETKRPYNINPFVEDSNARDLDFEEILAIQSPMTSVVAIKPGLFRKITLRTVLWALQVLADYVYNKGHLGSIGSIHFARWAIINNGKHLLFLSNYDGSWESYLGDFIDRAAVGLTAVWSNAVGFPPSRWLVKGGANYAEAFKTYAKKSQVATHFWYSAYPDTSMANKLNNRAIRAYLMNPKHESASDWLQRF